ncbi:MAG: glycosyltransferase family 4 protein [Methylobacterium frigidaeris]
MTAPVVTAAPEPALVRAAAPAGRPARWCFFSPGTRSRKVLAGDSRTTGGAEAQVAHLAAALAARGHAVTLIDGDGWGQARPETLAGVLCLDAAPDWRRPGSLAGFWRALREAGPDVVYARLPSDFLVLVALAARLRPRTRFVYALAHDLHTRAWTAYDHRRWFHAPLFALARLGAHRIAVQHPGQRSALAPSLRARAVPVPNIVGRIGAEPRDGGRARYDVVWVAKIRPEKRLDLLLDLARACPALTFAVVGGYDPLLPPGLRDALAGRAAMLANVACLGEMRAPDVLDTLAASRVLVNTSDAEGFPNTMLEAWSLGVPVVSLSVDPGGVIAAEGLGLVSRDAEGLARDVGRMVRDAGLNRACGARGQDYVRCRHGADVVVAALEALAPDSPGKDGRRTGSDPEVDNRQSGRRWPV